jgi:hypothetical protein
MPGQSGQSQPQTSGASPYASIGGVTPEVMGGVKPPVKDMVIVGMQRVAAMRSVGFGVPRNASGMYVCVRVYVCVCVSLLVWLCVYVGVYVRAC